MTPHNLGALSALVESPSSPLLLSHQLSEINHLFILMALWRFLMLLNFFILVSFPSSLCSSRNPQATPMTMIAPRSVVLLNPLRLRLVQRILIVPLLERYLSQVNPRLCHLYIKLTCAKIPNMDHSTILLSLIT